MNLKDLFEPKSVAVVGASAEPAKLAGMIVGFLDRSGYAGEVHLVNPKYERIGEHVCYPDVESVPGRIDLLVCVVPVAAAMAAIEAAARRGVRYCVLMTGGFGEGRTGQEGRERRDRLRALCAETGMHVVGPNTVGMVNFRARLPLTFADWYGRDTGQRGGVAIVTHSGSVGGLIFSSLQLARIGVDYWVGLGNEGTLETADFIRHFSEDPEVHTVICYLEGVNDGRKFLAACEQARRAGTRVVVLKSGQYPDSARSTLAHTGKQPSPRDIYAGVLRQQGVVQVASLSELSYAMSLLTTVDRQLGRRIGILSASGGACSVIADHVLQAGLELPELPAGLQAALDRAIPVYGSSANPVDLSADVVARGEILAQALEALREDDSINVWIVFGRPLIDRYHAQLIDFAQSTGKALVVCTGVPLADSVHEQLRENGVPVLLDPELCLRAIASVARAAADDALPAGPGRAVAPATVGTVRAEPSLDASAAPLLRVAVFEDADFRWVLAAQWQPAFAQQIARVVRALPLQPHDYEAMLSELGEQAHGWPLNPVQIEDALHLASGAWERAGGDAPLLVDYGRRQGELVRCAGPSSTVPA